MATARPAKMTSEYDPASAADTGRTGILAGGRAEPRGSDTGGASSALESSAGRGSPRHMRSSYGVAAHLSVSESKGSLVLCSSPSSPPWRGADEAWAQRVQLAQKSAAAVAVQELPLFLLLVERSTRALAVLSLPLDSAADLLTDDPESDRPAIEAVEVGKGTQMRSRSCSKAASRR